MNIIIQFDHGNVFGNIEFRKPEVTQRDLDFILALQAYLNESSKPALCIITGFRDGMKISAIKALRECLPGMSLAEGKAIMDDVEKGLPFYLTRRRDFTPDTVEVLRKTGLFVFETGA